MVAAIETRERKNETVMVVVFTQQCYYVFLAFISQLESCFILFERELSILFSQNVEYFILELKNSYSRLESTNFIF